ncbi:MAG: hypothetical protein ACYTFW_10105 [Planctomycetota bacterium]
MTKQKKIDSIELMETTQASFDYSKLENPMGESKKDALRVNFNKKLRLEFHGVNVTLPFFKKTASKTKNLDSSM